MENMDDPRSEYTDLKTEADFQARRGLSDRKFGLNTLEASRRSQSVHARHLQSCSTTPRHYLGWHGRLRRLFRRIVPGEM